MSASTAERLTTRWDASERDEVTAHNRAAWKRLKREHGAVSVADVPGFLEALETEWLMGYSLTDIATIYGVTRERVRQWFEMHDLYHDPHTGASLRIWDDELDCFVPVSREDYEAVMAEVRRELRMRERVADLQAEHDRVADLICRLALDLGRSPRLYEIAEAAGYDAYQNMLGQCAVIRSCYEPGWAAVAPDDAPIYDTYDAVTDSLYEAAGVDRPEWRERKFTDEEAADIRAAYETEAVTQTQLADLHGCEQTLIWKVVNRYPPYDGDES